MNTLSIIFNKEMDKVLVYSDKKLGAFNFVCGKIGELECPLEASYRELFEETGITKDDITLKFMQTEVVTMADGNCWNLYITYGVLNKDVELAVRESPLMWVKDWDFLRTCGLDGCCAVYLNRAVKNVT